MDQEPQEEENGVFEDESLFDEAEDLDLMSDTTTSSSHPDDDQGVDGVTEEFDTNIPTQHKYLGRLNSISGYSVFEDGEHLTLIAMHTNTIVAPGFILPLVLDIPSEQEMMRRCISEKWVFAVIFEKERREHIFAYGVIMEVFESFTKNGVMYLKARGRQRCKILSNPAVRYLGGRLVQIQVKALGENELKSPISCSQLLRLKALRPYCCKTYSSSEDGCYKYRRYHLAQFPYASWVYDHNEVLYYTRLICDILINHYTKDAIPTDPTMLSFWFLQNFQLLHNERLQILQQDLVLKRLKLEYKFLLMDRVICCRVCRQNIAEQSNVFAMSKDGVQSTYCNPGGHVYETVTIMQITNYTLSGRPSKEFSWFPGYEWTITQCQTCRSHIGWKFTSKHLQPREFFGLARASLDIKILNNEEDANNL